MNLTRRKFFKGLFGAIATIGVSQAVPVQTELVQAETEVIPILDDIDGKIGDTVEDLVLPECIEPPYTPLGNDDYAAAKAICSRIVAKWPRFWIDDIEICNVSDFCFQINTDYGSQSIEVRVDALSGFRRDKRRTRSKFLENVLTGKVGKCMNLRFQVGERKYFVEFACLAEWSVTCMGNDYGSSSALFRGYRGFIPVPVTS